MYDRLLVQPSVLQLVDALTEAQAVANSNRSLLRQERSDWEREATALKGERGGRRFWTVRSSGRATVGVAWWTDTNQRRHFRIVGRETDETTDGNPFCVADYPVLLDLYPEVGIFRALGTDDWAYVTVCGCGMIAAGPTFPGWAGPRCITCRDRGEPFPSQAGILDLGPAIMGVEWPEGFVVVLPGEAGVRVCDREGKPLRDLANVRVDWRTYWKTVVSPDGRFLITVNENGRLRVYELQGGAIVTEQSVGRAYSVRFSPCGTKVAIMHDHRVLLHDYDAEIGALHLMAEQPSALYLAWSGRGRRARVARGGVEILDESDQPMEVEDPMQAHPLPRTPETKGVQDAVSSLGHLRFTADGNGLRSLRMANVKNSWRFTALSLWVWNGSRWARQPDVPLPCARDAEVSPDGRWVGSGAGWITMTDVETGKTLGTVGWAGAWARFLADGRRLLFVNQGRLRVVPWAHLLNVPASAGG